MKYFCKICDKSIFWNSMGDLQKQFTAHIMSMEHINNLKKLEDTLVVDKKLFEERFKE